MSVIDTIDRIITHPLTVVSSGLGLVGSFFQVPFLSAAIETAWAQSSLLFGATSLSASQGWLPAGWASAAVAITAVLFMGRMIQKLWSGYQARLNDD